ncbi:MAG TPA: apolipoprotein N-acyltransferase [Geminicoccaceae bacterium]
MPLRRPKRPAEPARAAGLAPDPARSRIGAAASARPWLVVWLAGAGLTLTLPPVGLWPMLLVFTILADRLRRTGSGRGAFLLGWSFGFGHHLTGLYWIGIAFFADADTFGPLAVPAVLLLVAGLAILPGLATLATARARPASPTALALLLAAAWTAAEAARGWIFPWNLIGSAWIDTPVAQLAALVGVYGLSLLAVAAGALPVVLIGAASDRSWRPVASGLVVLAVLWAGGLWRLGQHPTESVGDVRLRLVQGNVAQHHKWQPELRARWLQRHLDLSVQDGERPTVVIWPESATPYPVDQDPLVRQRLAEAAPPGGLVITGGERFDLDHVPPLAWNSLFVIDRSGALVGGYDKHTLVPFGEYLPFRDLLGGLGIDKLAGGNLDFQAGPGPAVLDLDGLPPASPLICYEVIFAAGVVPDERRPGWLLNITNDAWFGTSSGPYQHLAAARMRAIEEGLPVVRSANTGISAVIDPLGRVVATLGLNRMGVVDAELPRARPPTPFARFDHLPALGVALLLLLAAFALERRAPRRPDG